MSPNNFPAVAGQQFVEVADSTLLRVKPDQHLQAKSINVLCDSMTRKTHGHVDGVTHFVCSPKVGEKRCWSILACCSGDTIVVIEGGIVASVSDNIIDNEKLGVR